MRRLKASCDYCGARAVRRVYASELVVVGRMAEGVPLVDISLGETGEAYALVCKAHEGKAMDEMFDRYDGCTSQLLKPRSRLNMKIRSRVYRWRYRALEP